ncbi:hypothetical protein C2S51_013261 [Perilla frutescens var. frutescens]|nr:hypothetical protein C2S51_013261 [Perilla frutescens var. frutescens]
MLCFFLINMVLLQVMEQHWLQIFSSRPEGMASQQERSSATFLSNQHDSVAIVAPANQFTAACSSSKKECNKIRAKLGLGLNLMDLKPHFGKRLEDVAEELGVGRSTIKRVCRDYGIDRWPCNKKNKSNPTNGISCRDSKQNVPPSAASSKNVTMKVGFEDDTIKFDFCLSSGMEKLLSEVGRRLNLKRARISKASASSKSAATFAEKCLQPSAKMSHFSRG